MCSNARGQPSRASLIIAGSDVAGVGRGGPAGGRGLVSVDRSVDCTVASSPRSIADRGAERFLILPRRHLSEPRGLSPQDALRDQAALAFRSKVDREVATLDRTGIL